MSDEMFQCSFCGKLSNEVDHLISGPQANICNECVDLCHQIVHDQRNNEDEER